MECLTISNISKMEAEVSFFFHKDTNGTTYLMDPPTMKLESGESKVCLGIKTEGKNSYFFVLDTEHLVLPKVHGKIRGYFAMLCKAQP